jgi:hypothetical protein
METWRMETSNRKLKPGRFFFIRLALAHHANETLLLVRLLTKKQTEVTRLQMD